MELLKIYDKTCDICALLAGIDEEIAQSEGFFFRQVTLEDLAKSPSPIRGYIKSVYADANDGMVDLPIYMLLTPQGQLQAEGVVKSVEELTNLITAWKTWASSANAK